MVFPEPGGPIIRKLCMPAAAISAALFTAFCPRICAKSSSRVCTPCSSSLLPSTTVLFPSFGWRSSSISSARSETPITSTSCIRAPSRALAAGTIHLPAPAALAASARASTPGIPSTCPLRLSSPAIMSPFRFSAGTFCMEASTAAATARSNREPALRTPAGARFTVILLAGRGYPVFLSAVRTRSPASFTSDARYPTIRN